MMGRKRGREEEERMGTRLEGRRGG